MTKRPYSIMLSEAELATLAWCADRGYFPGGTYDALESDTAEDDDPRDLEREYTLAEHEAWPIMDLRDEDPCACFACIGGELLEKLLKLKDSIV